jgi:xanthine dehydrogenase YagS FAD-binding subunit
MNKFRYVQATNAEAAARIVGTVSGAVPLAGGTDLLPLMKDGLASPQLLVDLSAWDEGHQLEETEAGLRVGALVTLAALATHEVVTRDHTALADACRLAAAQQLRNMGTIGGNLLQHTRCWYFRGAFDCWMKGGDRCYAREGENQQHAIFMTGPDQSMCVSAHPSDPAAALLVLGARIFYTNGDDAGEMAIDDFFSLPTEERRSYVTLPHGTIITGILLPPPQPGTVSTYSKAMARATWSFALSGVAAMLTIDSGRIGEARVALTGLAPIPFRVGAVEDNLRGKLISELDREAAAELLVRDAHPLAKNGYKVDLLVGQFQELLTDLVARQARSTG